MSGLEKSICRSKDQGWNVLMFCKLNHFDRLYNCLLCLWTPINSTKWCKNLSQFNISCSKSKVYRQGISTSKVCNLLGWEFLCQRRCSWVKQMCLFHRIIWKLAPLYLPSLLSLVTSLRNDSMRVETSAKGVKKQNLFRLLNLQWKDIVVIIKKLIISSPFSRMKLNTFTNIEYVSVLLDNN